ncbi:glycerol-3-phosphate 1-O-acyltransferase [Sphingomonas ginkgonis]|uniref:Glycerol-3-phosphate acyltransferase n=1 Tax=Sphingomonas ginkgonis TaxID=2315330 RepID=A0A3R9YIB0_9SPHN|nr:glycerol-3-phosphate 1-O-acyltransferase PlsY [Sphingomonas ginkgonis]RST30533.1 glycerol-3-phosphate 1-O-acyltransferase [Sphingomonas ginkgonis]
MTVSALLPFAIGYLLGAIPFGLILTALAGKGDIRAIGSGNIGATNVLRTGSKGLAAATLILDVLKGAAAVLVAQRYFPGYEIAAAAGALVGHLYSMWLRFQGGKGVATLLGILIPLLPLAAIVYAVVWLGLLVTLRISSVAGMSAAVSAPIVALVTGRMDLVPALAVFALLVIYKHRENIARLRNGTEPRVGRSRA